MKGIYIMAGYPDRDRFRECYRHVAGAGFDFIEVGIPYNDPVADGPVIAAAANFAAGAGVTAASVREDLAEMAGLPVDPYVMTYANIVHGYGYSRFTNDFGGLIRGIIIADLPNRMAGIVARDGLGIPVIPFATPETRDGDLALIGSSAAPFVYYVGIRGVTGSRADLASPELAAGIARVKEATGKKTILGFGIKTPGDAKAAMALADGFVVGTEAVMRQENPKTFRAYIDTLL